MSIEPLEPPRYAEAGAMLARAFESDPLWRYLFPDASNRSEELVWFFERWARVIAPLGAAYITQGGEGVAMWIPPDHGHNISLWRLLRAGLGRAPFRFGIRRLPRAWRVQADAKRLMRADLTEPHWILDILAVDPPHQRSGVGTALLRPILERADREHTPCYVLTHKPENVAYYERHGFRLLHAPESAHSAYSLRRPAA